MQTKASATASLISMEAAGYTLRNHWKNLFRLYTRDNEAVAELDGELEETEWALIRGGKKDDTKAAKVESALGLLLVIGEARRSGGGDSWGFFALAQNAALTLADALSRDLYFVASASTQAKSELAAGELFSIFRRAINNMVKRKFPQRARGSGEVFPRELLAIYHAKMLCERYRRLPSKTEVRAVLEAIDIRYRNTKDLRGKWRTLFDRAGLHELPD